MAFSGRLQVEQTKDFGLEINLYRIISKRCADKINSTGIPEGKILRAMFIARFLL